MDIESELILFLSVDIIGSTAYKNSTSKSREDEHPWLQFFRDFYVAFPEKLASSLPEHYTENDVPHIWKTAGDELIFAKGIKIINEICECVNGFRKTIVDYKKEMEKKTANLSLKATGWIAGFPIVNAKITTKNDKTDYIGPSMDTGFRLCELSDSRKFIIVSTRLIPLEET